MSTQGRVTDAGSGVDGREIVFWSCQPFEERLFWPTIEEAVESWALDLDSLPEMVDVYGWARTVLPTAERWSSTQWSGPLADLIERLDEEYGDPEEGATITDAMKQAELVFINAVLAEYEVWSCDQITQRTVRVSDYYAPEAAPPEPAHP